MPAEIWCELLTRFRREVKDPKPNALFRGSLIDENMFAIDVDEWKLPNLLEESRRERLERIARDQGEEPKPDRKSA